MTSISTSLVIVAVALGLAACSEKSFPESEIYTLYSSDYPTDVGRSGVATFDLANIPELNGQICQETADLYQADFEKRREKRAGALIQRCATGAKRDALRNNSERGYDAQLIIPLDLREKPRRAGPVNSNVRLNAIADTVPGLSKHLVP